MSEMNLKEELVEKLYSEIALEDSECIEFLKLYTRYCHEIDDMVDEHFCVENLIKTNNDLIRLMTCKYFIRNQQFLVGQLYLAAEAYLASEELKTSSKYEERLCANYLSHEGNSMLLTVALLQGGFEHLRKVAMQVRKLTYLEHPLAERNV